jgi:predicted alpha/beta hydrolase family esterase
MIETRCVLLLHGLWGSGEGHWQWWLKRELEARGAAVVFPELPAMNAPSLDDWLAAVIVHLDDQRPDTVVAHSLACVAWCRLAERVARGEITLAREVRAALRRVVLVAPVAATCGLPEVATFVPYAPPPNLIAPHALVVLGEGDPWLPVEEGRALAAASGADCEVLPDGAHLNVAAGFGPWPWLLEQVLEERGG